MIRFSENEKPPAEVRASTIMNKIDFNAPLPSRPTLTRQSSSIRTISKHSKLQQSKSTKSLVGDLPPIKSAKVKRHEQHYDIDAIGTDITQTSQFFILQRRSLDNTNEHNNHHTHKKLHSLPSTNKKHINSKNLHSQIDTNKTVGMMTSLIKNQINLNIKKGLHDTQKLLLPYFHRAGGYEKLNEVRLCIYVYMYQCTYHIVWVYGIYYFLYITCNNIQFTQYAPFYTECTPLISRPIHILIYNLINIHSCLCTPIYTPMHIQLDKALSDYDECIRLDPTFAEAYNKRAEIRQIKGKPYVILYYIIAYIMIYVMLYALYSININ